MTGVVRLTRRRAIEIAGAATAAAALRPASAQAAAFAMDVPLPSGATAAGGLRTLAPVSAPGRFELIGLDFGRAAHVDAEVRARRAGGAWTPWATLHDATQPCWTGPADEFQVRFAGAARRLQARFVRVDAAPRAVAASRRTGRAPEIIGRAQWGGNRLPPKSPPQYGVVEVAFVHHTVTANAYRPQDSASIVLGICRYHRDHNGWNDIGYNFLVDKYGQIFEGRDGGIELAVIGAQSQGYNSHSTGVSLLGDYTSSVLPADGVEAVARLLAYKLALHGVKPIGQTMVVSEGGEANRYREGTQVRLYRICGHQDGNATACPGAALYDQLPAIRRRTDELTRSLSSLTLRADRTAIVYPDTAVTLTGTLRFADRSDPRGAGVQIIYAGDGGGSESLLQVVPADARGAFSTDVALSATGSLRAAFPGDDVRPPVSGTPIMVAVEPLLTLSAAPKRPRAGRSVSISGRVEPLGATRASLTVHRRTAAGAEVVERGRVPIVDGAFATSFVPPRTGLYRVTLRVDGTRVRRHFRAV